MKFEAVIDILYFIGRNFREREISKVFCEQILANGEFQKILGYKFCWNAVFKKIQNHNWWRALNSKWKPSYIFRWVIFLHWITQNLKKTLHITLSSGKHLWTNKAVLPKKKRKKAMRLIKLFTSKYENDLVQLNCA